MEKSNFLEKNGDALSFYIELDEKTDFLDYSCKKVAKEFKLFQGQFRVWYVSQYLGEISFYSTVVDINNVPDNLLDLMISFNGKEPSKYRSLFIDFGEGILNKNSDEFLNKNREIIEELYKKYFLDD